MGTATLRGGNNILARAATLSPACYNAGRRIEMDVSTANTARLDFYSANVNTTGDYDGRIVCTSGTSGVRVQDQWSSIHRCT